MNKSEIAERAAREIHGDCVLCEIFEGVAPDCKPQVDQDAAIVERAIAESQDSQDCEKVAERVTPAGKQIPPEMTELGDGEPSPPPQELSFDQHADLLYSRNKWHMLCNGLSLNPAKSAVADVLKAVAGAAQEVSPIESTPSEFWETWRDSKAGHDAYDKYWPDEISAIAIKFCESWAEIELGKNGAQEVSPPSPDKTSDNQQDIEDFTFAGWNSRQWAYRVKTQGHPYAHNLSGLMRDFAKSYAQKLAGDTRELKAALKRAYELAHIFQKKVSWFKLSNESHEEYTAAWKELKEAERQLLDR